MPGTSTELVLPLVAIALGAFVIGTEGFMLAGILPAIAGELGVSIAAAGQLVTVFSLTFAIGSPVVAIAAGNVDTESWAPVGRAQLLLEVERLLTVRQVAALLGVCRAAVYGMVTRTCSIHREAGA